MKQETLNSSRSCLLFFSEGLEKCSCTHKNKWLNFDETLPETSHLIRQRSQMYPLAVLPPTKRIGETGCVVNEEDEWT